MTLIMMIIIKIHDAARVADSAAMTAQLLCELLATQAQALPDAVPEQGRAARKLQRATSPGTH